MKRSLYAALAALPIAFGHVVAFQPSRAGTLSFYVWTVMPALVVAAIGLWVAHREGVLRAWLAPAWGDVSRGAVGGGIVVLGALLFRSLVAPEGSPREGWIAGAYVPLGAPEVLRTHQLALLAWVLLLAASHGVVFRGLVAHLFFERFGHRAHLLAVVAYVVALIPTTFLLPTGPFGGGNPVLLLFGVGVGLVSAGLTRAFERLSPGVVAHALALWVLVSVLPLWARSG